MVLYYSISTGRHMTECPTLQRSIRHTAAETATATSAEPEALKHHQVLKQPHASTTIWASCGVGKIGWLNTCEQSDLSEDRSQFMWGV